MNLSHKHKVFVITYDVVYVCKHARVLVDVRLTLGEEVVALAETIPN